MVARLAALGQFESEGAAKQEMSELDEALAAIGLVAVWSVAPKLEICYLWPENLHIWNLYQAMQTQWNVGMSGPTGLNYPAIEIVMRKWRIKRSDEFDVFEKIQAMERATLQAWSEMRNG